MRSQSRGAGALSQNKDRYFNVSVKLIPTGEMFTLKNIHNDMKMFDMKNYAEFVTGIPTDIQRIRYLDEGDLQDNSTVRQNDIVGGAQLHMTVWSEWTKLIEAVSSNDLEWVFKLGVTQKTEYRTPNLDYMLPTKRKQWLSHRASVALFIAAHRGHQRLCERLIAEGADVNATTVKGRTALHVASARGHGNILDMLLELGGNIDAEDSLGENALTIAGKFGHKACERHLFLFRWQERAKQTRTQVHVPMFAHQYFDSAFPVWMKGSVGQVYYTKILPPGEYEGTGLGAPKKPGWVAQGREHLERMRAASDEEDSDSEDEDERHRNRLPRIGDKPLSAITEEGGASRHGSASTTKVVSFAKTKKKGGKKHKSFDEWLARKQAEDSVRIAAKRAETKKKKDDEDNKKAERLQKKQEAEEGKKDEKLAEAMKETSYEAWLAEQEATNKKSKKDNRVQTATGGKTTKEVIRALLNRKQQEGGYHGLPYEIWTAERDPKMFNQIKVHGNLLLEHYN